jgi:WD40 repeat protein
VINLVGNWQSELQLEWQGQLEDLVTALVCSPNGCGWVASSAAGEVVWNAGLLDLVQLQAADGKSIDSLAFSADSQWLAAGGQAGALLIWNCADANLPPQLAHKIRIGKWIEQVVWHPIESHLAISYGAQVQVWDIPAATEIASWKFEKSSVFDLAWHQTGTYLAIAGYKGVQIESLPAKNSPLSKIAVDTASLQLAWSGDGRYLAAGNLDRTLTIIDWQDPTTPWTLIGCPGKIRQIEWIVASPDPCVAIASGNAIVLWQLNPANLTWEGLFLEGHQDTVTALAAHPCQPMIGSASSDGYICLWSVQGDIHQIIDNTDHDAKFTALAWQPHGDYLLTGSQIGSIGLWRIPA